MHLLRFEHYRQPLATRRVFLRRLATNLAAALVLIGVSLVAGMVGYHVLEGQGWLDAYGRAAMILSGMGPYSEPLTPAGRFFAGTYALYSGLLVVATTGIMLAPVFHRVLHRLHAADEEDEQRDEDDKAPARKSARKR